MSLQVLDLTNTMHLETYSANCEVFIRPIDNQTFDCTTFVLKVLTVHGYALRLFWAKAFPLL